jgi:type I restriction enzyme S subunit
MWETVKLDEIVAISMGKTPSRSNANFWDKEKVSSNIWISIADLTALEGLYVGDSKEYVSDEGAKLFKTVPSETLVMSFKLSIGKLAITKCELRTNEAIAALPIKNKELVTKEYLYYFLSSIDWDALAGNDVKVKGKTLNKAKLKEIPILLPPLAEQQRIVAKLDAAFAEIDRAIEIQQEKIFLTSRIQARLASSIFAGRQLDTSHWRLTALEEVCTATQGVQIPKSKQIQTHQDGYLRYLYISDFKHAKSVKYVEDKYPKKLVSSDDLVMSNTGSQGQVFRGVEGILSNNLFKIGVEKELINVDYLFEFLKSDVFVEYQNERTRGTTQPHMGHKNFLSTPILLPPLSIQNDVVMKLHESNEVFERLFESISTKEEQLHTLKSAILAQELTPPFESEAA